MDLSIYYNNGILSPSKVAAAKGSIAILGVSKGFHQISAALGNEEAKKYIREIDAKVERLELELWVLHNRSTNNYRKRHKIPMRRKGGKR